MKSLRANMRRKNSAERRDEQRWHVELLVTLAPKSGKRFANVRNLSEKGMMLETDQDLRIGEIVHVALPGGHETDARIVWQQGNAFGCEFLTRIPTPAISAALLQAPLGTMTNREDEPGFEEIPIGIRPTMDELADWKARFQETHAPAGHRLVAFRQTDGGLMIAIVTAGTAG